MQNISEKTNPTGEVDGRACLVGTVREDGLRYVTDDEVNLFLDLRRKEIRVEARSALGERASGLTDEEALRLFYSELPKKNPPAVAAE